jgi:hypothetical protein
MHAIRWTAAAAGAALVIGALACAPRNPVKISPERDRDASAWTARLATPPTMQGAVQAQGSATIAAGENNNESVVEVHLENVAPGGVHPWKVQSGQCGGEGQELVKVTDDGRMLKVSGDGKAEATATVPGVPMPTAGDYAIVVMASPQNQSVVIACGNFAPPPAATPQMPQMTFVP